MSQYQASAGGRQDAPLYTKARLSTRLKTGGSSHLVSPPFVIVPPVRDDTQAPATGEWVEPCVPRIAAVIHFHLIKRKAGIEWPGGRAHTRPDRGMSHAMEDGRLPKLRVDSAANGQRDALVMSRRGMRTEVG